MLRYHARALNLAHIDPQFSPDAAREIELVEERIRRPFPPSLREWYSLAGACDLLNRFSNDDPPVPLSELGKEGLLQGDLLRFRCENQGVCTWAVRIDDRDDPPVFVDYDPSFNAPQFCATSFSEYVYCCIWDWELVLKEAESALCLFDKPLSPDALGSLRREFSPEPVTGGWPGHTQYRFSSENQHILICDSDKQSDWWLAAPNEQAISHLVQRIRSVPELGPALWSDDAVDGP